MEGKLRETSPRLTWKTAIKLVVVVRVVVVVVVMVVVVMVVVMVEVVVLVVVVYTSKRGQTARLKIRDMMV